jgi:hypothetical protein
VDVEEKERKQTVAEYNGTKKIPVIRDRRK